MTARRDSCPSAEALIDAAQARGDADARARVADHLIECARCAEEFQLLRALEPWADEHAHLVAPPGARRFHPGASGRTAAWALAAAAVFAVATAAAVVRLLQTERENRVLAARTAPPPASTIAALTTQVDEGRRRIADLEQRLASAQAPEVNAPIVDLEAADRRRSAGGVPPPAIPPDARRVVFVLNAARPSPGAVFDVDLLDANGRVVWTGSGLRQSREGTLTLSIPRALLTTDAKIRLFSRRGGSRVAVEDYPIPLR